jgi:arylformamidase
VDYSEHLSSASLLYDISVAYSAKTPQWPGDTPYSCRWAWDMTKGASVNVGLVTTSWHVGTHADAPFHVLPDGATSEALPLEVFAGDATVLDVSDVSAGDPITRTLLSDRLGPNGIPTRLLLRTGLSVQGGAFPASWPALTVDAAAWLTAGGLRLLGVDAPSVDAREDTALRVHKTMFEAGAWILENLYLTHVPQANYELCAYPVLVEGADAAPVRAVLRPLAR